MLHFFARPKNLLNKVLDKRYKVLECLGGGGFGDTYLAVDTRSKNQLKRVIKHFNPKATMPQDQRKYILSKLKRKFETEKMILERLGEEHPNRQVPRMIDHFEQWGEFFYVQEFVDGSTLKEEIKGRWPEAKVRALVTDILEILAFVHEYGVIHRDVKPDNILRRNKDQKLVLIDFGAVKEVENFQSLNDRKIASSLIIGTRGYMSAEQANGKPCYGSDIYSVGMIGLQCLTGRHPVHIPLDERMHPKWRDLAIASSKFSMILDCMVSYRPMDRYKNAREALEVMRDLQLPDASEWLRQAQSSPIPAQVQSKNGLTASNRSSFSYVSTKASAISVSYETLEQLLKVGDWRGADEITTKLILAQANCQSQGYLEPLDVENLNYEDIKRIDKLWTDYSNGHFGFSVQGQLWQQCGAPDTYDKKWEKFGEMVGWQFRGSWRAYSSLYFSLKCSRGMLPNPNALFKFNFIISGRTMHRIYNRLK